MSDYVALIVCCVAVWLAFRRLRWIVLPPVGDSFQTGNRKALVLVVPGRPIDWPPGTYMLPHAACAYRDRRGIWIKVYGPNLPVPHTPEGSYIPRVNPYRGWTNVPDPMPTKPLGLWLFPELSEWDCREIPIERIGIVRWKPAKRLLFPVSEFRFGPIQHRGIVKSGTH